MQLIDFLKTADKDEYIYVGVAVGGCFLWIAKPDDMIVKLSEMDAKFINRIQLKIEKLLAVECGENSILKKIQQNKIAALERQIERRIPFGNREIKDMYKRRFVEPLGTIVIIEGKEWGSYWMLDELEVRTDDGNS